MIYDWKRFWCPRDGVINLGDNGFMHDPEGEYYQYIKSDVVPFEKISQKACLILLGEPGIGKSTAMLDELHAVEEKITDSDDICLYINLNGYGNESRLIADIFGSQEFNNWIKGKYVLHLFIDSLDECRVHIPTVANIINSQLNRIKGHLNRLKLRIACRTAHWPSVLENELPLLWNKNDEATPDADSGTDEAKYDVYELAPLRRIDVREAAEKNAINPNEFIDSLVQYEVVPLAIKPITLEFLINSYKQDSGFPSSKIELYETGCKCLCEEHNPSWSDIRNRGTADELTVAQKLGLAAHIAATAIFCRKPTIYTRATGQLSDDEILITDLITDNTQYTERNIKEVLATGLFSSRGQQCFGFAHQTYAEYLAALQIVQSDMGLNNIEDLLYNQIDSDKKVVPQLSEVSAWLLSFKNDVLRSIAANDPQVLLKGDAGYYTDEDKSFLVASMLELLEQNRINTRDWDLHSTYHKLKHPGLSEQLRPIIENRESDWRYRYDIIEIAECCELKDLQEILLKISLDTSDNVNVRDAASRAVSRISDDSIKEQLLPLLTNQDNGDFHDQLKGNACRALWPSLVDAQTLFSNLSLPRKENFSGSYSGFLSRELTEGLKTEDIPHAINWLNDLVNSGKLPYSLERLSNDLVAMAWQNLANSEILEVLAELSCSLFRQHKDLISDREYIEANKTIFEKAEVRYLLTEKIVDICEINTFKGIAHHLVKPRSLLVGDEDIQWLVNKVLSAGTNITARKWARILRYVRKYDDPVNSKLILETSIASEVLRDELGLSPVVLNSEEARQSREYYEQEKQWQEQQNTPKPPQTLEWLPADRIVHWLSEFEKGKLNAWYQLCIELTLEDTDKKYYGDRINTLDITTLPGWNNSDENIHSNIIAAAETFLKEKPADPLKWIRKPNSWSWWDIAPNKAFAILKKNAIDKLDRLAVDIWQKWVPALLGISLSGKEEDGQEIGKELIAIAYAKCPDTFIFFLEIQIDAENALVNHISVHEKLDNCWDDRICGVVLNKISQPYINIGNFNSFRNILRTLVCRKYQPAIEYSKSLMQQQWSEEGNRKKVIEASIVLIANTENGCWDSIWPTITSNTEYGRELLLEFAYLDSTTQVGILAKRLSENAVAELYIWLVHQFPHSEDPQHDGAHSVGRRDAIARFRDDLLRFLENAGTIESCRAIERIILALPEMVWIKTILVEARKNTRRCNWEPLTPELFHKLLRHGDVRYVNSEIGLLDVIIDSLGRLEEKLQGQTSSAVDLWNQIDFKRGQERYRPKDENSFSDYAKRHFENDLQNRVVALREVQIRRGLGDNQGENTDVYVTLPATDTRPNLTVIIECKGCWHNELNSAMQTQLVNRYLADNQCRCGLYLVGWFYCSKCYYGACRNTSGNIMSTKPCHNNSIDDLRSQLNGQAESLSRDDLTIKAIVLNVALR